MSPKWKHAKSTPRLKGWYITRTDQGDLHWRAWGNGGWWKQLKDGWIEWFDGEGNPGRYDWKPSSRQSIAINSDQLPEL